MEVDLNEITPEQARSQEETAMEMPDPGVADPQAKMIALAKSDLAARLEVDVAEISVLAAEPRQWRNSALGCPAPGMNYLMAITPGFQITLESGGQLYDYHTDRDSVVILCGDDGAPVFPPEE